MDHAPIVIYPELFPALQVRVVNVVALSSIASRQTCPIFPDNAVSQFSCDVTGTSRHAVRRGDYVPVANPKVELTIFCTVKTRLLVVFNLLEQCGETRIAP